jgi:hypothetical protein
MEDRQHAQRAGLQLHVAKPIDRCVSSIPSEGYSRSPTETQLEFPAGEGYEPRLIRRLYTPGLSVRLSLRRLTKSSFG